MASPPSSWRSSAGSIRSASWLPRCSSRSPSSAAKARRTRSRCRSTLPRCSRAFCCSSCSPATRSFFTASASCSRPRSPMEFVEAVLLTVITASTPLLLAASGELVVERAGVLNLGLEGMMIVGAACGFAGAYHTGSIAVGALCGILGGAALSAVFAAVTLGLAANQVASGLALTILGVGLSGLIGAGYVGQKIEGAAHLYIPWLTDIPFLGRVLLGQNGFVSFSVALIVA